MDQATTSPLCPACESRLEYWRTVPELTPNVTSTAALESWAPEASAAVPEPERSRASTRLREIEPSATALKLMRCSVCGLARVAEPTVAGDHSRLYETGVYRSARPRFEHLAAPLNALFDRQRLGYLRRSVTPCARVLDAGAGRGRFLERLIGAGYEATGIEPSSRGYEACRTRGIPVKRVQIESAEIQPESLDAVVLWHVLEHLADPARALKRIRSWLVPGGTLLLGVPNLASLQALLGGDRWFHLDLPRHLYHFTPAATSAILGRSGFRVERIGHLLAEHNQLGMWQTLLNRLTPTPNFLYRLLKRDLERTHPRHLVDAAITIVAGIPLLPVAAVLELIAGLTHHGGAIVVVAKRATTPTL